MATKLFFFTPALWVNNYGGGVRYIKKKNLAGSAKTLNKVGYMAFLVACSWAGAVIEKVTVAFCQDQCAPNT